MKLPTTLLALACLAAHAPLSAQEKPASEKPLQLAPEPAPTEILIPNELPQIPKPAPIAIGPATSRAARPSKTQVAEDAVKQRIQYRLAKNKAVRDPAVVAALETAQRAKTDLEKREAMKRYYTLLNARIRKIDGSVAKVAREREEYSTRRLEQTRIDPTEPLDPDERTVRQGRD
jgi:hypothetical protein